MLSSAGSGLARVCVHCLERWIFQSDTSKFSTWTWLHDVSTRLKRGAFIISHGGSGRRVSTNARQRDTEIINIRQGLLHVSFVSSPFKALLSTCLGAAEQPLGLHLDTGHGVLTRLETRLPFAKSGRGLSSDPHHRKDNSRVRVKQKPHSVANAGKHRKTKRNSRVEAASLELLRTFWAILQPLLIVSAVGQAWWR